MALKGPELWTDLTGVIFRATEVLTPLTIRKLSTRSKCGKFEFSTEIIRFRGHGPAGPKGARPGVAGQPVQTWPGELGN